jgi:hypothetical protein
MAQASGMYNRVVPVTKSDTVNFDGSTYAANAATKAIPADAIAVDTAGNVIVVFENGATTSMHAPQGAILPVKCIRINSTLTTATGLNALYQV